MSRPWERPARRVGASAMEALASMQGSELTALLLELFARRARRVRVADVRRRFFDDEFVMPSSVSQRDFVRLDAHLLAHVPPHFEAVELSPLAPFATTSTLGLVHPHNVMATIRGQEVLADATDVLAILCAKLRETRDEVHLTTSHRVVRAQRDRLPNHTQHFRLISFVSAGRGEAFAARTIGEHIALQLALLSSLPEEFRRAPLRVTLSSHGPSDAVRALLPDVPIDDDPARLANSAYYRRFAFKVWYGDYPLGDGGCVDWLARLRSDRREQLVTSAMGTELLLKAFQM
jgi:hypothetical protein